MIHNIPVVMIVNALLVSGALRHPLPLSFPPPDLAPPMFLPLRPGSTNHHGDQPPFPS